VNDSKSLNQPPLKKRNNTTKSTQSLSLTKLPLLLDQDPQIAQLIDKEGQRQLQTLGLIPSENHISPAVSSVLSSILNAKYAEGFAGRRYYEGNIVIDEVETLAVERVKSLFGVPYVNVQPYSGSPANSAIQFALMQPGDTMMGLALSQGGHLTHGHPKVTFSGKYFNSVQFGLNDQARIDFDQVRAMAKQEKPQVILIGTTAYPFELDFAEFRKIADEVGAWLVADISHIAGLVVTGDHPSPVPHVDVVMSTSHKTFRGPRGAMIMVTERGLAREANLGKKIDSAIIPGLQGGPHNATTAGIAVAALEATRSEFKTYSKQIRSNANALAAALQAEGLQLVGGGTENHLMVIDLSPYGPGQGTLAAWALNEANIVTNRNTVPGEQGSPFYPSGVRIGTPLITTRGLGEAEVKTLAAWIKRVTDLTATDAVPADKKMWPAFFTQRKQDLMNHQVLQTVQSEVAALASQYPLFTWQYPTKP
jgi:glycine hydroxymethyltransferase